MKRKRKGFSLIEVIVTLAIFMIIMAVSVEVIVSTFTDYIVYLDKSIAMDSLDNCMINIDNIFCEIAIVPCQTDNLTYSTSCTQKNSK